MRKFLIILICLCCSLTLSAQSSHAWSIYLAYHNTDFNVQAGEQIYALYEGNLLSYRPKDQSVRRYSKLTGLTGKYIQRIAYSSRHRLLVIVYADGNIDLLHDNGRVVNLRQYAESNERNKRINDLYLQDDWGVVATSSGIIVLDLAKQEIKGYYDLKENVSSAIIDDKNIYVTYDFHCRVCPLFGNLADKRLWEDVVAIDGKLIRPFAGRIWCITPTGLFHFNPQTPQDVQKQQYTSAVTDHLVVNGDYLTIMTADKVTVLSRQQVNTPVLTIPREAAWQYVTRGANGQYWVSQGDNGLQAYAQKQNSWQPVGTPVGNYGPTKDLCYYMKYVGERLLIGGGFIDYSGKEYPPVAMAYENGKWMNFETKGVAEKTGIPFRNVTSVVQDPKDANHHFVSATTGLYEYRNFKFVKHFNTQNSPLKSALADGNQGYVFVQGLIYDAQNNLWMLNDQTDTILQVYRNNHQWKSLYLSVIDKAPTMEQTLFDRAGRLWATSRRTVAYHNSGVLCYDFGGTLNSIQDDKVQYRSSAYNEDGTRVDIGGFYSSVYAIAEDLEGSIWIGAGTGVFVVNRPEDWFKKDFVINQPKVPRNDATNYADYLLSGVAVTAIAIDGANRKWLGTGGSGVYLVSADGTAILHHFTAENSPLLSNNIYSVAVNAATGLVMVGTDQGLCAYQSDATAPAEVLEKTNVNVYPNPVRPNFQGQLTVTGLTQDADIRITTVSGQAVAGGRSVGGTYQWDLTGTDGKRVPAGVYYIQPATAEGNTGVVVKVLVL